MPVPRPRRRDRDRAFRFALVAPSIAVLLLVGVFPLVYLIVVSFQNVTMTDVDTSFQGLLNFRLMLRDRRLWEALLHTLVFIAIALPLELGLGLAMALLFIEHIPGRDLRQHRRDLQDRLRATHSFGVERVSGHGSSLSSGSILRE